MKNLLLQSRVVSDPVKHPLVGWWTEFYFFYVKLRDLNDRELIENMLIANGDVSTLASAAQVETYHNGEGINWTRHCLDAVTRDYFRSDEENQDTAFNQALGALPQCKINVDNWMESLKIGADAPIPDPTQDPLIGQSDMYPELPDHLVAYTDAYEQWKQMRDLSMAAPTFENYLRTFGIRAPAADREEKHQPELLRYIREWSYPSNTIDPTSGTPSSALSWSIAERADKDRFFAEPGFVFGVTTSRPKVYLKKQVGAVAHFLNDGFSWLPALLAPDPFTSLKKFTHDGSGPLDDIGADYWADLADIFHSGDQFVNFDLAGAADASGVSLPAPTAADPEYGPTAPKEQMLNKNYASSADVDALFTGLNKQIKVDGRCDISVLTRIQDTTP
jgi:hypothetical protein